MDQIKNMNVLITGAASGIGLAYAQHLLKNGAKVVAILDLPTSSGTTTVANLEKEYGKGKALFIPTDVTNIPQFEESFKKAVTAMNGVDIVINNAGMLADTKWEATMRLNIGGVTQGSIMAMDYMGKHKGGKGGTLVNISSIAGIEIFSVLPVYCASKHYVAAFDRCLEPHFEKTGVRVLTMCPGLTHTNLFNVMVETGLNFVPKTHLETCLSKLPGQTPENVAHAMVQLIQMGKNGSMWVSEGEQPPVAVEIPQSKRIDLNL